MPKYLSGRAKRVPQDQLSEDRYQYLGLDQAEPNLSDPLVSPSVPSGAQYQLVAVPAYPGKRYWVPVGGGLVPGAITIFDEDSPVSASSSITQLNFVGAAVTANVSVQSPSGHPGIAATVTVIPVSVGETPPNNPTPNEGELWWESDTGDLYIYYDDGDSAQWVMTNAGGRGLTGDKGQKGEVGSTGLTGSAGDKGDKGEKGQQGDVEAQGNKGQKGEIGAGQKGQKGEAGVNGTDGDKGQKGEDNSTKGQKGDVGIGQKGEKGQKGTEGGGSSVTISDNAPGSANAGDLWWDSDDFDLHVYYGDGDSNQWVSVTSNAALKGQKGEKGEKGQKGEIGVSGGQGLKGDKGQKGEGANVATSSNPPSSPDAGDLWWDTDDGDLHVYYNDGNTSQWVNTSGVGAKGEKGEEGSTGSSDIRSANIAVSTGESNTSSYNFSDKVSLSINTTSTSRVLVHYAFEIRHSASNNVYCTGRLSGSIGITDMVGAANQNLDFTESANGYVRHSGSILDVSSYSGTRTYKIQFANGTQGGSSTGYSYIRNATLVLTEMTI